MNANTVNEPTAASQSDVSTNLLKSHLKSFIQNDLQTVMSDYTEKSVFITQEATYTGLNEIKEFFTKLIIHFSKKESKFELEKMVVKDDLGFIVWHAITPSLIVSLGTDTFIIKDGKISQQTFVAAMNFIHR